MNNIHFYEPASGHGLPHDPFKAIVGPRPIGWVSTLSAGGVPNLAPYSFFNAVCETPPIVVFSSSGPKDSLANVEATGEFVWNMATRPLAEAMNATSAAVPLETDEFALAGLETAPSRLVAPPRVAASPASPLAGYSAARSRRSADRLPAGDRPGRRRPPRPRLPARRPLRHRRGAPDHARRLP